MRSLFLIFLLAAGCALAQTSTPAGMPASSCGVEQQKQFDFWLGEWEALYDGPGGTHLKASNRVTRELDGCVVEENFLDDTAANNPVRLKGHSVSTFVPQVNRWKQTWVDNTGAYLDLTGEFRDGKMVLERSGVGRNGKPVQQRMTYFNISANQFDWNWELSQDGGKTWALAWHLHYVRKQAKQVAHSSASCGDLVAWAPLPQIWLRYFLSVDSCN